MSYDVITLPAMIEQHCRVHGTRVEERFEYRGLDVFLADGGPHFDSRGKVKLSDMDKWMHDGYYIAAYFIQRGRQVFGQPLYFPINHDIMLSDHDRKQSRLKAARFTAKQMVDAGFEGGLYGAPRH